MTKINSLPAKEYRNKGMNEAPFQDMIVETAQMYGWRVHHSRKMQTNNGSWITPIQGDKGFPDLVMAHPRRGVIFAELKKETGKLDVDQKVWGKSLDPHVDYFVWRPSDWDEILKLLSK